MYIHLTLHQYHGRMGIVDLMISSKPSILLQSILPQIVYAYHLAMRCPYSNKKVWKCNFFQPSGRDQRDLMRIL